MNDLPVWGEAIRAAYELADMYRSPGTRSPLQVQEPQRSILIQVIRSAYADGWNYSQLGRQSGVNDRVLRQWAVKGGG